MLKRNWLNLSLVGMTFTAIGCATPNASTTTNENSGGASNGGSTSKGITRYNSNGNEAFTGTRDAMYKGDSIRLDAATAKACGNLPESHFAFDSATLNGSTSERLDGLAACFAKGPLRGKSFSLVGHTDPRGGPEYNKELGKERAESVARYLAAKGVDRSHIKVTSAGEANATGTNEAGWAADRVVDVNLAQ